MYLTPHFTLEEAIISQTAKRLGIDNTPSVAMFEEIRKTALFMERIRSVLGDRPISPSSWYRCPGLERVTAKLTPTQPLTGHHPLGAAVDFICPSFGTPLEVCKMLEPEVDVLGIGQLIHEYDGWVHISRLPVPNRVNRIITIDKQGALVGLHTARV